MPRLFLIKCLGIFFFLIGLGIQVPAQSPLDSMEQVLPTLAGKEKLALAGELAYQYCFVNTDKALKYGELALDLAMQTGDSLAIGQAWNDLATVHASRGEFKESIDYSTNSLRVRQKSGDSLLVANSCNKLGFSWLNMGVHDKALDAFLRAARIYEQVQDKQLMALVYNNIGSVHLRQGNETKAIEYLEKAGVAAIEAGDSSSLISSKTNIASIHFENGEYEQAQAGYQEVLELIAKTGIAENLGTVQMNLGACHVRKSEYKQGIECLHKADSIFIAKGDSKGEAMAEGNLALGYIGLRDFATARAHLEKTKILCEKLNSDQQWFFVYDGFYRLESAEGNVGEAMRYYALANQYREKIYTENASKQIAEMETRFETEKKEQALQTAQLKNRNQLLVIAGLIAMLVLILVTVGFLIRNQKLKRETMLQQSVMAWQEERLRISRDLHDNIGAELTLISSSAEEGGAQGNAVLKDIGAYARTAMGQLRETVWAIRSETIAMEAFAYRVGDYARRLCAPVKMVPDVRVTGDGSKVLSPTVTLQLYRLCQEAIHNAVKYSGSPTLDIHIVLEPSRVTVSIADQGIGFDPTKTGNGYGLGNMKARAAESGGKAEVTSAPGKGTTVTVTLPV